MDREKSSAKLVRELPIWDGSEQFDFFLGPIRDFGRNSQLPAAFSHSGFIPLKTLPDFLIRIRSQKLFLRFGPRSAQKICWRKSLSLATITDGGNFTARQTRDFLISHLAEMLLFDLGPPSGSQEVINSIDFPETPLQSDGVKRASQRLRQFGIWFLAKLTNFLICPLTILQTEWRNAE